MSIEDLVVKLIDIKKQIKSLEQQEKNIRDELADLSDEDVRYEHEDGVVSVYSERSIRFTDPNLVVDILRNCGRHDLIKVTPVRPKEIIRLDEPEIDKVTEVKTVKKVRVSIKESE